MRRESTFALWLLAVFGAAVLPWHIQQDGLTLLGLLAFRADDAEAASALAQALRFGRFWFWPVIAALAVTLPGALPLLSRRARAHWLIAGGAFGLLAIAAQGFAIGINGWTAPWLEAWFGPLDDRQFGIGLGAVLTVAGFLFSLTTGLAYRGLFRGDCFVAGLVGLLVQAVVAQIVESVTNQSHPVAGITSTRLLAAGRPSGILYGPHSPNYQKDGSVPR